MCTELIYIETTQRTRCTNACLMLVHRRPTLIKHIGLKLFQRRKRSTNINPALVRWETHPMPSARCPSVTSMQATLHGAVTVQYRPSVVTRSSRRPFVINQSTSCHCQKSWCFVIKPMVSELTHATRRCSGVTRVVTVF